MSPISMIFGRMNAIALALMLSGCGPYRVTEDGRSFYTREIEYPSFTDFRRATNAVTGGSERFHSDAKVESISEEIFNTEVAKAKAELQAKKEAEEARRRRVGPPVNTAELRRREIDLEFRVWRQDFRRWYDYFKSMGYADDEAAYKADRMTGGRGY